HDAVAPAPRKHRFLQRHLGIRVVVETTSYFGVLAFIIFTDDAEIDVTGWKAFDWRRDAVQQAHRTQVDILLKLPPDGNEQSPQRNMIGNTGIADGTKIDGVETAQLVEPIFGHHPAGLEISLTAPVKILPGKGRVVTAPRVFQCPEAFGHDLATDSIAFDDRNLVMTHSTPAVFVFAKSSSATALLVKRKLGGLRLLTGFCAIIGDAGANAGQGCKQPKGQNDEEAAQPGMVRARGSRWVRLQELDEKPGLAARPVRWPAGDRYL